VPVDSSVTYQPHSLSDESSQLLVTNNLDMSRFIEDMEQRGQNINDLDHHALAGIGYALAAVTELQFRRILACMFRICVEDGSLGCDALAYAIRPETGCAFIQRSCGYSWLKSLRLTDICRAINLVKKQTLGCVVRVDNCHGAFVETSEHAPRTEPTEICETKQNESALAARLENDCSGRNDGDNTASSERVVALEPIKKGTSAVQVEHEATEKEDGCCTSHLPSEVLMSIQSSNLNPTSTIQPDTINIEQQTNMVSVAIQEVIVVADNEGTRGDLTDTSMHYQALASSGGRKIVTSVQQVVVVAGPRSMDDHVLASSTSGASADTDADAEMKNLFRGEPTELLGIDNWPNSTDTGHPHWWMALEHIFMLEFTEDKYHRISIDTNMLPSDKDAQNGDYMAPA
jgi:hypothetical protein